MAFWNTLKNLIGTNIYQNNNQEITGHDLQMVLYDMVNSLGQNYTFAGIATPVTSPGVPDGPVFYLAVQEGIYANFNNVVVSRPKREIAVISWDGCVWSKYTVTTMVNSADVEELQSLVKELIEIDVHNIHEQLDAQETVINRNTQNITACAQSLANTQAEIAQLTRRLNDLQAELTSLDTSFEGLKADIEATLPDIIDRLSTLENIVLRV